MLPAGQQETGPADRSTDRLGKVLHHVVAHPAVYEVVQRACGYGRLAKALGAHLAETDGASVLDVGAGTGSLAELLPSSATYIWLDSDTVKLGRFRAKSPAGLALLADATRIPLVDRAVDYAVCVAVSHHLTDAQLRELVSELQRVVRRKLVFADATYSPALRARLLWRYDRGGNPRPVEDITQPLSESFVLETKSVVRAAHDHLVCVGVPKSPG
jgi:SAM-dependent methyltransferase